MICSICLRHENANTIKTKCCHQRFHLKCLDQWVKQEKFTCPSCCDGDDFMASLPFQKFLLTNEQNTLPPSHKTNMVMREALTEALDHIFTTPIGYYIKTSNRFGGRLFVTAIAPSLPQRRPLRSDATDGFFFDYKEAQVWMRVSYAPYDNQDVRYNVILSE